MSAEPDDPSTAVEAAFARLAAGPMADLPLNNPGLRIEAVGFRRWEGLWVGVLVSPWTISLLLLPSRSQDFRTLTGDSTQTWAFPSGRYAFRGGLIPELGAYQSCSLFSPPSEFIDHASARATAQSVMTALFQDGAAIHSRRDFLRGQFARPG